MAAEKRTPDEIKAQVAKVLDLLRGLQYADRFEIEDYPIGRNDRGTCRVEAEYRPGYGSRLVRTTTNARGGWNKPHKSQYNTGVTIPARDICGFLRDPGVVGYKYEDADHDQMFPLAEFCDGKQFVGWAQLHRSGVSIRRANYDSITLLRAPNGGNPPQRQDQEYSVGSDVRVMKADAPEIIAAYDAYAEAVKEVFAFFKAVKEDVRSRAAEAVAT